jgi:hypothetical protein
MFDRVRIISLLCLGIVAIPRTSILNRGRRRTDPRNEPPYSTRECSDWMGVEPEYIRETINQGKWTSSGLVRLEAQYIPNE